MTKFAIILSDGSDSAEDFGVACAEMALAFAKERGGKVRSRTRVMAAHAEHYTVVAVTDDAGMTERRLLALAESEHGEGEPPPRPRRDSVLVETLGELEDWCEQIDRTVQLVHRVRNEPRWAARVLRTDSNERTGGDQWIESTGERLADAFAGALELYMVEEG